MSEQNPFLYPDGNSTGYDFDNVFGTPFNIVGGNQNSNGDLGGFLIRNSPENVEEKKPSLGFFSNLLDFIAPDNYDPNAVTGTPNSISRTWVDRYITPSTNDPDSGVSFGTKALLTIGAVVIGVVAVRVLVKKL